MECATSVIMLAALALGMLVAMSRHTRRTRREISQLRHHVAIPEVERGCTSGEHCAVGCTGRKLVPVDEIVDRVNSVGRVQQVTDELRSARL